ncbi:rhodanese-like domain-containing protein [Paenibacillus gansuensis]|uniref:Rhodanese-like domain-containing protein n=1 Tax=Paenibacillus gansuensis TaxID=306542 RepID=A0ABW5PCS5_9BACL
MKPYTSIAPNEFLSKYKEGMKDADIIDVREPEEWDYYHLEESRLVPMNTIPVSLDTLSKEKTLYVICAHGVRSEHVCYYLNQAGYGNVVNVEGGMAAVSGLCGFKYD